MPTIRIRVIGSEDDTSALITVLHGIEGVERIEEVADLRNDAGSISTGMRRDTGPGVHAIEVDIRDRIMAERVQQLANDTAELLDSSIKFVDKF